MLYVLRFCLIGSDQRVYTVIYDTALIFFFFISCLYITCQEYKFQNSGIEFAILTHIHHKASKLDFVFLLKNINYLSLIRYSFKEIA